MECPYKSKGIHSSHTPPIVTEHHIYRLQRSWAKVIFSQVCVKNSVHRGEGVCLSACWDTPPWTRHTTSPPWDQAHHPPGPGTPPETRHTPRDQAHPRGSRLQHTVNERPVRILLECISCSD